jgi:hypothetical protein
VLDPEKHELSTKGHLTKTLFLLFSVLLHKNEYIPGVLSFKIKFASKIDPPYCVVCGRGNLWGKTIPDGFCNIEPRNW